MIALLLNLELHLRLVGLLLLLLAGLNILVPVRFGWRAELQRVTLLTRQVFAVHCFFIILLLVMMGVLALGFAPLLLAPTPLASVLLFGLGFFWLTRLVVQFFVYSPKLWRGNRFNTIMHVLFSCLWAYFSAIFSIAWCVSTR